MATKTTGGVRDTMAMIFLLLALATSQTRALHVNDLQHGIRQPTTSNYPDCQYSSYLTGRSGDCDTSNNPDCCVDGRQYQQFHCSPSVTAPATWAALTVNSFRKGRDGGSPSECDRVYHGDSEMVVALSTGWFNGMSRCGHSIKITARNGVTVSAKVVDECDSVNGCDAEHNYEKPCPNNVVDASPAVWDALGLDQKDGLVDVTWSDE